jgi:hypothetical protein
VLATVSDTRSMAGEMSLSEHTIQHHLTSIFAKTGSHDYVTVLSSVSGSFVRRRFRGRRDRRSVPTLHRWGSHAQGRTNVTLRCEFPY